MRPLERITTNPKVMGGKPCIRGMRVTVGMIIGELGAGRTIAELLADFPYLEEADIRESLTYTAQIGTGVSSRQPASERSRCDPGLARP